MCPSQEERRINNRWLQGKTNAQLPFVYTQNCNSTRAKMNMRDSAALEELIVFSPISTKLLLVYFKYTLSVWNTEWVW